MQCRSRGESSPRRFRADGRTDDVVNVIDSRHRQDKTRQAGVQNDDMFRVCVRERERRGLGEEEVAKMKIGMEKKYKPNPTLIGWDSTPFSSICPGPETLTF